MGGSHKKSRVHKIPQEYMIKEDDVDFMAQMVRYRIVEYFDEARRQRDRMHDELENTRQLIKQII